MTVKEEKRIKDILKKVSDDWASSIKGYSFEKDDKRYVLTIYTYRDKVDILTEDIFSRLNNNLTNKVLNEVDWTYSEDFAKIA